MDICAAAPSRIPRSLHHEVSLRVERILADGPRREECKSEAEYHQLRRLWAWEQSLRHGPKLADPTA